MLRKKTHPIPAGNINTFLLVLILIGIGIAIDMLVMNKITASNPIQAKEEEEKQDEKETITDPIDGGQYTSEELKAWADQNFTFGLSYMRKETPVFPPCNFYAIIPEAESLYPLISYSAVEFQRAFLRDPQNAEALAYWAYAEARLLFHRAMSNDKPPDPIKIQEWIDKVSKAIRMDKQNDELWTIRGIIRIIMASIPGYENVRSEALKDFDHAIDLFPDNALALFHRGTAHAMGARANIWGSNKNVSEIEPGPWGISTTLTADQVHENILFLAKARVDMNAARRLDPNNFAYEWVLRDNIEERIKYLLPHSKTSPLQTSAELFSWAKKAVVVIKHSRGFGSGFVGFKSNTFKVVTVMTNRHVVEDVSAQDLTVHTYDGEQWPVSKVIMSSDHDLAVLVLHDVKNVDDWKIVEITYPGLEDLQKEVNCPFNSYGNRSTFEKWPLFALGENSVKVGERIVIIGHPGVLKENGGIAPLGWNLSQGTVSKVFVDSVFTDAETNPGNSGGPIFNLRGHIVGVLKGTPLRRENKTGKEVEMEGSSIGVSAQAAEKFLKDNHNKYIEAD